ncbi:NAD-dependent epimerase/dehydratase family protein [Micromonosporaceae bacterium B7E4]
MRVLVTGGAGFIGSHVVSALLRDGHEVVVVDDFSTGLAENLADSAAGSSGRLTVHEADIATTRAARIVADARADVVFLLAAQTAVQVSMRDPMSDVRSNLLGLVNMLDAACRAGSRKVVFASSGGTIYGSVPPQALPIPETQPHIPLSFYGLTKSAASGFLRLYRREYGLDYAALALGNVYGPRQRPGGEAGVVAVFAQRLLDAKSCRINGDGTTTRDFVHVSDVTAGFMAALRRGSGTFNIGTGVATSVLEVYQMLAGRLGVGLAPELGPPLPAEVPRVRLDITRAAELLGWRPVVRLPEGLDSVVDWLRHRQPYETRTAR